MRQLFILSVIGLLNFTHSNAQEIGLRFGDVSGGNVAIDGIFSLGKFSRLHADVSFGNALAVDVLWDFAYRPIAGADGLSWYAGVGPYIRIGDPFYLGVVAEGGIEYKFKAPIVIGCDWRPALSIIETTDLHYQGWGFNVRYVFGK